jgi:hypothetical protein
MNTMREGHLVDLYIDRFSALFVLTILFTLNFGYQDTIHSQVWFSILSLAISGAIFSTTLK